MPSRLADKFDNIIGLRDMRDNVKEMVRNLLANRDCPKDAST